MNGEVHMDSSGMGVNAPIVALSFLAGTWAMLSTLMNPVLASILVGLLCKGLDVIVRHVVRAVMEQQKLRWRREARRLKRRVQELEAQQAAPQIED